MVDVNHLFSAIYRISSISVVSAITILDFRLAILDLFRGYQTKNLIAFRIFTDFIINALRSLRLCGKISL